MKSESAIIVIAAAIIGLLLGAIVGGVAGFVVGTIGGNTIGYEEGVNAGVDYYECVIDNTPTWASAYPEEVQDKCWAENVYSEL